jgi:thiol-disulfide isomerase/thioredoxin
MKTKLLILLGIVVFTLSCHNSNKKGALAAIEERQTITISGKVKFPDNRFNMYISQYRDGDKVVTDSFELAEDGSYRYEMNTVIAGEYALECQKWQTVRFWAEDEDLEINFRGKDTAQIKYKKPYYIPIKGGPKNELMNLINYNNSNGYEFSVDMSKLVRENLKNRPQLAEEIRSKIFDKCYDNGENFLRFLASEYAECNSVLSVVRRLSYKRDKQLVDETLATLGEKKPGYAPLLTYVREREAAQALKESMKIGNVPNNFVYPTPDGEMVALADYKGKIVVVDFWASWCGSCRQEIPHLKEVYEKYHKVGVEILSVSIDKDEKKWKEALAVEKMPWTQVLAANGGKELMKNYQFRGIPFIIILDKEGKIAAKQLRGKDINTKLDEMLSEK